MRYSVTQLADRAKHQRRTKRQDEGEQEHLLFEREVASFLTEEAHRQRRALRKRYIVQTLLLWLLPWLPLIVLFRT